MAPRRSPLAARSLLRLRTSRASCVRRATETERLSRRATTGFCRDRRRGACACWRSIRPTWRCSTSVCLTRTAIDLLRQLRSAQPESPVIITTAYMSIEPQLKVLDLPHHGYLVKPFDLDDLGARIDAVR